MATAFETLLGEAGFTKQTTNYDDQGHETQTTVFGSKGQSITIVYDTHRNPTKVMHLDVNGRLRLNDKLGFAQRVQRYDDRNHLVEEAYYGPDGALMLYKKQYARATYRYDDTGQCVEVILWDVAGEPIPAARVTVLGVSPGSQAEKLGLQPDDILMSYGGIALRNTQTLVTVVRARAEGGKSQELHVQCGNESLLWQVAPGPLGVSVENR